MKTKREASQLGIVSYDTALKALGERKIISLCNNTTMWRYSDRIAIRLHSTDVVTYYPDGSIRLDSGGYRTATTKDRINRFSPFQVWQVNFKWYVARGSRWSKESIVFISGMVFDKDGIPYDKNGIELGVDGSPVIGGHTLARLEQSK